MKDIPPFAQIQKPSPVVKIKKIDKLKYQPTIVQVEENPRNKDNTLMREEHNLSEYKPVCNSQIKKKEKKTNKQKEKKNYSKSLKCDKCNKKYTWYSRLANHKILLHNNVRVK